MAMQLSKAEVKLGQCYRNLASNEVACVSDVSPGFNNQGRFTLKSLDLMKPRHELSLKQLNSYWEPFETAPGYPRLRNGEAL